MTVEMILAWVCLVIGCALSAGLTGMLLPTLRRANVRQHVRDDGPESHLSKAGTPSMGGLAIHATIIILVGLLAVGLGGLSIRAMAVLAFMVLMAMVGFSDDYMKLRRQAAYGFGARIRLLLEFAFAAGFIWFMSGRQPDQLVSGLTISNLTATGWTWRIFAAVVLVGSANAVNLTDGLDGLAAGLTSLCAIALAAACWLLGEIDLALMALAVAGASAGFLWYNAAPASVFMGDVGSIGLGAALGAIAVAARVELLLLLAGLVFVFETISVIAQVVSYQLTGRRVLRMTPLHHHYELCGWKETRIVTRFWVVGAALAGTSILYAVMLI